MRISDWSSDVCSSDLVGILQEGRWKDADVLQLMDRMAVEATGEDDAFAVEGQEIELTFDDGSSTRLDRSEEHTSELQSLMRITYAVFCLKKKNIEDH